MNLFLCDSLAIFRELRIIFWCSDQHIISVMFLFFRSHIICPSFILQDPGLLRWVLVGFFKFLLNFYGCRYMCWIDVNLYSFIDQLEEILLHLMREKRNQLAESCWRFSARRVWQVHLSLVPVKTVETCVRCCIWWCQPSSRKKIVHNGGRQWCGQALTPTSSSRLLCI